MDPREIWASTLFQFRTNPWLQGAVDLGVVLTAFAAVIIILAGVTWILKRFFKRHEGVDRAHQVLIYLITMLGVLILLIGGILGIMLPVVPGVLLILMGLLLLRRYHTHPWVERNIKYLTWRLRMKRTVKRARVHVRQARKHVAQRIRDGKLGKALRGRNRRRTER